MLDQMILFNGIYFLLYTVYTSCAVRGLSSTHKNSKLKTTCYHNIKSLERLNKSKLFNL